VGYLDSDMAGDIDSRKSTSSYLITFARGVVAWQSRLQSCVALSTTEAEFIVITEACKELLWLKKFLQELGFRQDNYSLFVDSRVLSILVRIQLSILDPNLLMLGIIGYVILWMLSCWQWKKFIQMIMVLIWWLKHCQEESLKFVVRSPVWRLSPHI